MRRDAQDGSDVPFRRQCVHVQPRTYWAGHRCRLRIEPRVSQFRYHQAMGEGQCDFFRQHISPSHSVKCQFCFRLEPKYSLGSGGEIFQAHDTHSTYLIFTNSNSFHKPSQSWLDSDLSPNSCHSATCPSVCLNLGRWTRL